MIMLNGINPEHITIGNKEEFVQFTRQNQRRATKLIHPQIETFLKSINLSDKLRKGISHHTLRLK